MINLALNLLDEWPMKSQAVRIVSHKASDQNEIYVNEIGEIYTADNERIGQIRDEITALEDNEIWIFFDFLYA